MATTSTLGIGTPLIQPASPGTAAPGGPPPRYSAINPDGSATPLDTLPGGAVPGDPAEGGVFSMFKSRMKPGGERSTPEEDILRVKLRPKPGKENQVYGERNSGTIMTPLFETGGVIFPYTPVITTQFGAEYSAYTPIHSIMDFHTYQRTPAPQFTIMGQFSVQNQREGAYAIAVIHFFRTVTKMYFGQDKDNGKDIPIGLTPPVLLLSGYGNLMFNNLPVIVTNYTIELVNTVDYVKVAVKTGQSRVRPNVIPGFTAEERRFRENAADLAKSTGNLDEAIRLNQEINNDLKVKIAAQKEQNASTTASTGIAYLPSVFNLSCSLTVQHTPSQTRQFNMEQFRRGELLTRRGTGGGWW